MKAKIQAFSPGIQVLECWYNVLEDRVLTIEQHKPEMNVDRYINELNKIMDQIQMLAHLDREWNR